MFRFCCFLFLSLLTSPLWAEVSSPSETKLLEYLRTHREAQVQLLEKLVNINSGTHHLSGVKQVGKLLQAEFQALGFKTYWVEEPAALKRAPTLVAEQQGSSAKGLLLIGHLDTVFPVQSAFQRFMRQGQSVQGPGVIDDKGGDLVILYALKALQATGQLKGKTIRVVLTGDEEDAGKPLALSRKPLIAAAEQSEVALDFEWAMSPHGVSLARRGISGWLIETEGQEAHSSEIFQAVGDGAIFELARILDQLRQDLSAEKGLSFNPGLLLGGTTLKEDLKNSQGSAFGKVNVIAKRALAKGDLRFLTAIQAEAAKEKMRAMVARSLPGTKASIQFQDGMPAMEATKANQALLDQYSKVSEELGYGKVEALDPGLRGAGDISIVAALVKANLVGLGPYGTGAHSERETLDLSSLYSQTEKAAVFILRFRSLGETQDY